MKKLLFILLLYCNICNGQFAAVQTTGNSDNLVNSVAVTMTSTGINNLVIIGIYLNNNITTTVTSVTDDKGNTYVVSAALDNSSGFLPYRVYQAYGVQVTGGVTTVTVNLSNSLVNNILVIADEYSGGKTTNATVFNSSTTGQGTGTSLSVSTLTATTGGLIVAFICRDPTSSGTLAAGTGYTIYGYNPSEGSGASRSRTQYKLSGAATETAPANLDASGSWSEIATAFIPLVPPATNTSSLNAIGNMQMLLLALGGVPYHTYKEGDRIVVFNLNWECGDSHSNTDTAYVVRYNGLLYIKFDFAGYADPPVCWLVKRALDFWREENTKILKVI